MDLENFIGKVPLFSSIPTTQIREVAAFFHIVRFKKDDIIFNQGDQSGAMYIIRSGVVRIYGQKPDGYRLEIELQRGDFFGEIALISDLPRTAGAKVSLDAVLFCLKKKDFKVLLNQNRHMGLFLSRLYARRLSCRTGSESGMPKQTYFAVSSTEKGLGLSHFLYSMSYHIATESDKNVLVIEPHLKCEYIMEKFNLNIIPCPDESLFRLLPSHLILSDDIKWFHHPSGFHVLWMSKSFKESLCNFLPRLLETCKLNYDMIFFSLADHFGGFEQQAVRLCDKNMLVINNTPEAFLKTRQKLEQIEEIAGIGLERVRVGVSHLLGSIGIPRETLGKKLNLCETPQIWVEKSDKAMNDKIDTEKRFPVKGSRAIARELAGVRVGLALGAGAARGWAHIGVLKVLADEGIHIDMIAGTSMGALVGAIFATRGCVDHLISQTIQKVSTRTLARRKIFDYTFPLRGFLRGKKVMNLVAAAVENADFMDLSIPTYIVGVDILKGEEVLFETGDVAKAVRSSLSIPGIFAPFKYRGRWMVDGGLLNPIPINILEQKGADKIIAVCVENPYVAVREESRSPNILKTILQTINIVHGRATPRFALNSDVVIYPETRGFSWDDFHKGALLMQKGEDACRKKIKEIKAVVNPLS